MTGGRWIPITHFRLALWFGVDAGGVEGAVGAVLPVEPPVGVGATPDGPGPNVGGTAGDGAGPVVVPGDVAGADVPDGGVALVAGAPLDAVTDATGRLFALAPVAGVLLLAAPARGGPADAGLSPDTSTSAVTAAAAIAAAAVSAGSQWRRSHSSSPTSAAAPPPS